MKTQIRTEKPPVGESIEEKVRKASTQNTPIDAISPMLYTNAKDGVLAATNIRADRFDIALDAIDHYQASESAKTDGKNLDTDKDLPEYVEQSKTEEQ